MRKLKNRKSGIIGELHYSPDKEYCFTVVTEDPADIEIYKTLEELSKTWTDYIEPQKGKWYINENNEPEEVGFGFSLDELDSLREIGLLFDTEEETERAVRKLKAWTRLKDKGFRFNSCKIEMSEIVVPEITITAFIDTEEPEILNLVNLLFGGEE